MCKDHKKVKKTINVFKFISFLGFGLFGITGAGFYLDFMAQESHRCHHKGSEFNQRQTPDCYSYHFFGVGWLVMAAVVPFFGLFGECKPKMTIYGAILAFLAGIFGFYYVVMVFVDDRPYDFRKDSEPKQQFGHGFILMGQGLRDGFELLQVYLESFLPKKTRQGSEEAGGEVGEEGEHHKYKESNKSEATFELAKIKIKKGKS